tara:strand:+ start:403 stop:750 length:348 start_codon:yes stop_codon:yes gene_type:complete
MEDNKTLVNDLKKVVKDFVDEREWGQFHSPKNLSMSIAIESAELMELFQWLSHDESKEAMAPGNSRDHAIEEIADILIYIIAFCNENNVDIKKAIDRKMKKNKSKYPAKIFKGRF